jgi:hypothetical protein
MNKPKYETCQHVQRVGELAVYTDTGCPRATKVRGTLLSSKMRCVERHNWKERTNDR